MAGTYEFILAVEVDEDHVALDDPEWIADAAWGKLANDYGLAYTYGPNQPRQRHGVGRAHPAVLDTVREVPSARVVAGLVPLLIEMALTTVAEALPGASVLETEGEMNEDWLFTLRIQRVLERTAGCSTTSASVMATRLRVPRPPLGSHRRRLRRAESGRATGRPVMSDE